MNTLQYITDNKGKKLFVVLPIKKYQKLVERLDELEDILLYDKAKAGKGPSIPFDLAIKRMEGKRGKR